MIDEEAPLREIMAATDLDESNARRLLIAFDGDVEAALQELER